MRCGARFLHEDGTHRVSRAPGVVLLATGGAGQVYRETTNPLGRHGRRRRHGVSGRRGRVADLEFVQFHPTALTVPGQPRFLLSEALRGEGARLVNASGEAFMTRYDPAGDLAPRDRVSRAASCARRGGPARRSTSRSQHLDPDFVHERFPLISDACRQRRARSGARPHSGRARRRTT